MIFGLAAFCGYAQQTLNVYEGEKMTSFTPNEEEMTIEDGFLTIQGTVFDIANITKIEVVEGNGEESPLDDNTVLVQYNGETAIVSVADNIKQYVTFTIEGADVTINQSDEVSAENCGEITYILKGESDNGSFLQNGSYKSTIELQGLTLTNPSGAAIDIENGKRIELSAKNGTVNTLVDGEGGKQKAALYCKGHLELKGKGFLSVTGNTSHAIGAKEYVEMKNLTLEIPSSVKDGINCAQYFLMESGSLTIANPGDDGIQVAYKDDSNREDEDTGSITISGGELVIGNVTATAAKALKAEGDFIMNDGTLTAKTSAPGEWDSSKTKTKASACLSIDGMVRIDGGELQLTATGGGGKGISCEGDFVFNDGTLTILTEGGVLAYVNGELSQNYTGNTDRLDSDYKSSPKGVKTDGNVEINGGDIFVTTSGNGGEGIESKAKLTVNGGDVTVRAKDDAINSSKTMTINGGNVDVISTGNDGLDSNGDLYITGGVVMAFGAGAPECGIDVNSEGGYKLYFTGGYILGAGGGNSTPTSSESTQPFVTVNLSLEADMEVSVSDASGNLYTFTTPSDLTNVNLGGGFGGGRPGGMGGGNGSSLLISIPEMTNGSSYTIKAGDSSASGTAKLTGSSGGFGGGR